MENENSKLRLPHLVMQGIILAPGQQWKPRFSGWSFVLVRSGVGYCLEKQTNLDLPTGAVLLLSHRVEVNLHASQLGAMNLAYFRVAPELLTGLITLGEQSFFEDAAGRRELALQFLAPAHPVSARFRELCEGAGRSDFGSRLQLLDLFSQAFDGTLKERIEVEAAVPRDAKERLRQFLDQTLASEWLNLSFAELVQRMNCSPRHLSRIFRELVGTSFREKQAKIRLSRASELLASTESKVVDVALDSGFQSLNLFNLMFRKRFGLSPGRWRKERQQNGRRISPQRKSVAMSL